jgi:hypothetical protein
MTYKKYAIGTYNPDGTPYVPQPRDTQGRWKGAGVERMTMVRPRRKSFIKRMLSRIEWNWGEFLVPTTMMFWILVALYLNMVYGVK